MKLRNPFLIQTAAFLGATFVGRLIDTLDIKVDYGPWGRHPTNPRDSRFIYVFWHDSMLLPTIFRTRAHILISHHADGELIAQLVRHFRFGVVRGSSSRGGAAALLNLMRISERGHLCVTPDGPRGPRRRAQPGTVFLGSQTGLPIIPVGVGYSSAWRAPSWDRFAIPKPFSQARVVVAEPIVVPQQLAMNDLARFLGLLEERLTAATADAEHWADGLPRQTPAASILPLAKSA
jgi:lysophospholipid acyltransferase (LPLAT)-like uncharacterized protein